MTYKQGSDEWAEALGVERVTAEALRAAEAHGDDVDYDAFEVALKNRDPQRRFGRRGASNG